MEKQYPNLFSPIRIRNITLKNRIQAAPVQSENNFAGGAPTEAAAFFYGRKAADGAAIVTVGDSPVNSVKAASGGAVTITLADMSPEKNNRLKAMTYAISRHDAVAGIQLNHGGIRNKTGDGPPLGPSPTPREDGVVSAEMTKEDIKSVIADFVDCALKAKLAGFGMIQLNGGHGWLISQFASPLINRREDEYGGSLENRARFAIELLDAIREAVGDEMIIDFRISGDDHMEGGMKIDDTIEFIKLIEDKIDIVNISVGTIWSMMSNNYMFPLWFVPHGNNVEMAARVKKAVSKCLVAVVGGIGTPELAEEIIAEGKADLVAICRALIADPDWVTKSLEGRADEIIPCVRCISCHEMFDPRENGNCAVNPETLRRLWLDVKPPTARRKVVVIGGGPGGMQAAITAAQRGHEVTLFEKSDALGGTLRFTDCDTVKKDINLFKNYQAGMIKRLGVDVRLNTEATPELVGALNPHTVIAALGGGAIVPRIKGIERAMPALDAYYKRRDVGGSVVIIGGNLTGCELAIDLAADGRDVTVIEMTDKAASGAPMFYGLGVREELVKYADRITILTNTSCVEVLEDGVACVAVGGETREIKAQTVIYAVGYRPNNVEPFRNTALRFRAVGDCKEVRKLKQAVEEGFFAAIDIV